MDIEWRTLKPARERGFNVRFKPGLGWHVGQITANGFVWASYYHPTKTRALKQAFWIWECRRGVAA